MRRKYGFLFSVWAGSEKRNPYPSATFQVEADVNVTSAIDQRAANVADVMRILSPREHRP